jgi:hypothetical protein
LHAIPDDRESTPGDAAVVVEDDEKDSSDLSVVFVLSAFHE